MPKEEFAVLDGAWLSGYQFRDSFPAEVLSCVDDVGAVPTLTVYKAATHHGFSPLGIVSAEQYTPPVAGRIEYVGVGLPFRGKERSKFSVLPIDRV